MLIITRSTLYHRGHQRCILCLPPYSMKVTLVTRDIMWPMYAVDRGGFTTMIHKCVQVVFFKQKRGFENCLLIEIGLECYSDLIVFIHGTASLPNSSFLT